MGSALVLSATLRDLVSWPGAWTFYAVLLSCAALLLSAARGWFSRAGR